MTRQVRTRTREVWRPVIDWEGFYAVSDFGRVRSLDRIDCRGHRLRGRILRPSPDGGGYPQVTLCRDGVQHTRKVHHLVARAFHGPAWRYKNPAGWIFRQEVRHIDGDPANRRADNLAWGTKAENQADRVVHGTTSRGERNGAHTMPHRRPRGERQGSAKLTDDQVQSIRLDNRLQRVIAAEHGVSQAHVSKIKRGETWSHAG